MSEIKERPILFNAQMVRAILADQKTQTRRIIRPQPISEGMKSFGEAWKWNEGGKGWFSGVTADQIANPRYGLIKSVAPPHGKPGDRLWVRESWRVGAWNDDAQFALDYKADALPTRLGWLTPTDDDSGERLWDQCECDCIAAGAVTDDDGRYSWDVGESVCRWRPSIHMPRWASRITLEITDVRVQRLQEISEEDAQAEGVERWVVGEGWREYGLSAADEEVCGPPMATARESFETLWNSIYGEVSWNANPWVWAYTFRRLS